MTNIAKAGLFGFVCSLFVVVPWHGGATELHFIPEWTEDAAGILSELSPELKPEAALMNEGGKIEFRADNRLWRAQIRTVEETLTNLEFRLLKPDGVAAISPSIPLALPRRPNDATTYPVNLHLLGEPQKAAVDAYYADMSALQYEADWVKAFVLSDGVISYLQGDARESDIPLTPPLGRALAVYADSVSWLVDNTEWFGLPARAPSRLALLTRFRLSRDERLSEISERILSSDGRLRGARYLLPRRVWRLSVKKTPFCNERFPAAHNLYKELSGLPDTEYDEFRKKSRLTRSVVLDEMVRCFRQLMTVDGPARRFFLPEVIDEQFGGMRPKMLRDYLERQTSLRLHEIDPYAYEEIARLENAAGCQKVEAGITRNLCDSLVFLNEIESYMVR
ncbi:hypothetical protein N7I30_11985 [Aurantimonas litoralis]|nr:hypothetical protein [Aurantimonas litoralis]